MTTDTIPAGTLKVGDLLESFGIVSKTGTGTVILRVQLSDGTNAVQFVGTTSGSGAVQLQAGNRFALLATKSQSSISVGTPFSSGTTAASTLDESKAWTVQWSLQQSVPSDTSTLVFRNTTLTR
ncbi:hypothetical protein DIE05_29775 [Burkholderia sp. Bp8995]|nr:hypothetical protein DIE05_29775 [Burkholderia sp. Bp8995]